MRPRFQNFEELVEQNKQELWENELKIDSVEERLDKKETSQDSDKVK
ncbi:Fur-regulated basic protein B [Lentibacillus persicus]|uniref:Fur-regulated basic protein B n=1 Tax=Lentibacillus persicus TaxID=640948 RepID=A0A1I1VSQ5_9BACI|nr:FbpB family small basic protein [Lentibacillus persicus]SFD84063.1 Fur-regulated basic protein B [Lentibacillus persicus]